MALEINTLTDIAEEIHIELNEPTDIAIVGIVIWLRNRIGDLNILINSSYSLTATGQITPEISNKDKSILKKLYFVYYYGRLITSNLGASGFTAVQEVDSDGARVKMVNKTELAKLYKDLKKQEMEELNKLVNSYKIDSHSPAAVYGDDTEFELYNPAS